ncbi:hypothetical protein PT23B2_28480 (plasmid) [Acinetobacter towneri]
MSRSRSDFLVLAFNTFSTTFKYFLSLKKAITTPKNAPQNHKIKGVFELNGVKNIKTIHAITLNTPSALKKAEIEDKNSFFFRKS